MAKIITQRVLNHAMYSNEVVGQMTDRELDRKLQQLQAFGQAEGKSVC